jgi:hypothetical protein
MFRAIVLFACLNLALSGGWYVLWDQYFRSPVASKVLPAVPAVVKVEAAELGALLEGGQWVSPGHKGRVLYKIGFRQCPDCINFEKSVYPALHRVQVDTRTLFYAPRTGRYAAPDGEQRALDTIYRTRDWAFFEAWMEDANPTYFYDNTPMEPVEEDPQAQARIAAAIATHASVARIMKANGFDMERPAMFWQDEGGRWRVIMGDTPRIQRLVRKAFNASTEG